MGYVVAVYAASPGEGTPRLYRQNLVWEPLAITPDELEIVRIWLLGIQATREDAAAARETGEEANRGRSGE